MKKLRSALKNKIVRFCNTHWKKDLGAFLFCPDDIFFKEYQVKWQYFERLIFGTAKDGRAIFLYASISANPQIPAAVADFMLEMHSRRAIVGVVYDTSDAWDVIYDNEKEYPRKRRTMKFLREENNVDRTNQGNGSAENEAGTAADEKAEPQDATEGRPGAWIP